MHFSDSRLAFFVDKNDSQLSLMALANHPSAGDITPLDEHETRNRMISIYRHSRGLETEYLSRDQERFEYFPATIVSTVGVSSLRPGTVIHRAGLD